MYIIFIMSVNITNITEFLYLGTGFYLGFNFRGCYPKPGVPSLPFPLPSPTPSLPSPPGPSPPLRSRAP